MSSSLLCFNGNDPALSNASHTRLFKFKTTLNYISHASHIPSPQKSHVAVAPLLDGADLEHSHHHKGAIREC